jgi:hypothetical protein
MEYFLLSLSFEYPESMIEKQLQGKGPLILIRLEIAGQAPREHY